MPSPFNPVRGAVMNIVQACEHILGAKLARSMIANPTLGLNWCVISAMCQATTAHNPQAIAAIKAHNAELKGRQPPLSSDGGGR